MECNRSIDTVLLQQAQSDRSNQTQMKLKPAVQRSAKGPINIDECSPDGKYIQLANTSAIKDVDLTGWHLLRNVNNGPQISFVMPNNFKLNHGETFKIYAYGQDNQKSPFNLVALNFDSWGVGPNVLTRLFNNDNEEKASHIQKTTN